ncbi:acetate kinase [Dulcicalothrix desertica PCC 7102]|uniref:Acetate kinase n=1 Tax=Dulcicalothrix desertica PCC 7102 TaxID=232991 RepID=A0A3S1CGH9_9CYAN|nr:acetate kinase [Dulcicalothrix desertica]RUT03053.1 acetate kinase [Dulcicalothrix desertica PCC 7102]TWH53430.1 acetate kinase [Dulcicalothrix desertica PCC 7102]
MKILVLNAGSSSQKSCLYEIQDNIPENPPKPIWSAQVEWRPEVAKIKIKTATAELQQDISASHSETIAYLIDSLHQGTTKVINDLSEIDVVGHRVVHGGKEYQSSVVITQAVIDTIQQLATLAPAHNPVNLKGIEAIQEHLGDIKQVAVFDTAFHSHIPDEKAIFSGAYEWVSQGIRRYGFHGISHQYCTQRAAKILGQNLDSLRLINCHLGNGCSLAAVKNGRSIDTTMGFTPLDGLMMGSRSGAIDPGLLIHLLRQENYTPETLDNLLNKSSGLLGISGISGDMRQILGAISQGNERAKLAYDIYIHRLRYYIGAMLASLQGLDVLIFTAGVGENSPDVRFSVCEAFGFLGLLLDNQKNHNHPVDINIAAPESKVKVLVIHTQEDWQIACECFKLH